MTDPHTPPPLNNTLGIKTLRVVHVGLFADEQFWRINAVVHRATKSYLPYISNNRIEVWRSRFERGSLEGAPRVVHY